MALPTSMGDVSVFTSCDVYELYQEQSQPWHSQQCRWCFSVYLLGCLWTLSRESAKLPLPFSCHQLPKERPEAHKSHVVFLRLQGNVDIQSVCSTRLEGKLGCNDKSSFCQSLKELPSVSTVTWWNLTAEIALFLYISWEEKSMLMDTINCVMWVNWLSLQWAKYSDTIHVQFL